MKKKLKKTKKLTKKQYEELTEIYEKEYKKDAEKILIKEFRSLIDYHSSFDGYLGAFAALGVIALGYPIPLIVLIASALFFGILTTIVGIISIKKSRYFNKLKKRFGFKLGFY